MVNENFKVLLKEVEKCCEGLNICEVCEKEECLMGYIKAIIHKSLNCEYSEIASNICIPVDDVKIYSKNHIDSILKEILELIKKLDKENDHTFSIMRSCCEIALVRRDGEYEFN
ncbi:MAG: hypothetical protein E7208_07895 [Clostridium butyricum]|nr:hypothetical protein [Clostridium butyricum]